MAETLNEEVLRFDCAGERLWGLLSRPATGTPEASTAVAIVTGGPQYRVGSHRQFVLLGRALARAGYPALRFDYRGMGDSEGPPHDFEQVAPDLRAALDALQQACPAAQRIVVWGLCDAAAAALMFATDDARVAGIVAANPWARSDASLAAARVKHYYGQRLLQREFWVKLLRGGLDWRASLVALAGNLRGAARLGRADATGATTLPFQTRMARGLAAFRGRVLLLLSGNDITAKEFLQYTESAPAWKGLLADPKVQRVELAQADHTFSSRAWMAQAEQATIEWLRELEAPAATRPRRT